MQSIFCLFICLFFLNLLIIEHIKAGWLADWREQECKCVAKQMANYHPFLLNPRGKGLKRVLCRPPSLINSLRCGLTALIWLISLLKCLFVSIDRSLFTNCKIFTCKNKAFKNPSGLIVPSSVVVAIVNYSSLVVDRLIAMLPRQTNWLSRIFATIPTDVARRKAK